MYNESISDTDYSRGYHDGGKDKEIELLRMHKALQQTAHQMVGRITQTFIAKASESKITIHTFHLKMENWDKIALLLVVSLDDYVSERINDLYVIGMEMLEAENDDIFQFDFTITYQSDDLNRERIISDGYTQVYEHTPVTRSTQ